MGKRQSFIPIIHDIWKEEKDNIFATPTFALYERWFHFYFIRARERERERDRERCTLSVVSESHTVTVTSVTVHCALSKGNTDDSSYLSERWYLQEVKHTLSLAFTHLFVDTVVNVIAANQWLHSHLQWQNKSTRPLHFRAPLHCASSLTLSLANIRCVRAFHKVLVYSLSPLSLTYCTSESACLSVNVTLASLFSSNFTRTWVQWIILPVKWITISRERHVLHSNCQADTFVVYFCRITLHCSSSLSSLSSHDVNIFWL